jgi:hypothetical protein
MSLDNKCFTVNNQGSIEVVLLKGKSNIRVSRTVGQSRVQCIKKSLEVLNL